MTKVLALIARICAALLALLLAPACGLLGESPEPKDVDLRFEGLGPIDREEAVRRVAYVFEDFAKAERPEPALDDAAFELELLFRDVGFREVRIETRLERPERGDPVAVFEIDAGVRTRLAELRILGVPEQKERDDARAILRGSDLEEWYSERAVRSGARAVRQWYRERGHAEVTVGEPRTVFSADGRDAIVEVDVAPGPRYVLARVDVEVQEGGWPEPVARAAIDEALRGLVRGPYSDRVLRAVRGRVANVFAENGFPDAAVDVARRDMDPAGVVLDLRVRTGSLVRIGDVRFRGQDTTSESFLEKRVVLEPGAWYRRSNERQSLANLSRAGLFDRVTFDLEPSADGPDSAGVETRDLSVELVEAASREFHVEPGYGSYERLRLGFGARQKNLFGSGRILDLTATVAELAQRADLSLIDPWILGPDATAIATVFWNQRQEPSFERLERGVELGAAWRLSDEWRVRMTWQYRLSDVNDVEVDAPELVDDIDVSEVSFEPTWDSRDAFDDPRKGHLTRGWLDLSLDAFGSQVEYSRGRLEHAQFIRLSSATTLALSARVGVISPLGSTEEIPIQERFFNGGENSVRSFLESELGPVDADGTPVGGEAMTVASVEVRQGLWSRFQAAAFVDAGTVELQFEDVFRFSDPGFGIGLGIRYLLPIGPIRLDGAINPDPGPGEANSALHLSVGFAF